MHSKKSNYSLNSSLAIALILLLCFCSIAISQSDDGKLLKAKVLSQLKEISENLNGIMGVAAKDLISGEEIFLNQEIIFPQASSIKVPILIELFHQAEEGKVDLSSSLWLKKKAKTGGSGILNELGDDSVQMSIKDFAILMILVSDNTATNIIIDLIEMDKVNRSLKTWGLKKTELRRRMMDVRAAARNEENISTPYETMTLLEKLYRGELLNQKHAEEVIEILKKPKHTSLRKLLPPNIPVADKPGGVEGAVCCIGIVYLPHRPYIACIMTKYLISEEEGNEAISQASRVLYNYFYLISRSNKFGRRVPPIFLEN